MTYGRRQPGPEEGECIRFAQWLDMNQLLYTHVGHGNKLHKSTANKLKAMGLKPGVPDYLIFEPVRLSKHYVGLAIEMKRVEGGRTSEHQKKWLEDLRSKGWYVMVCNGADEAIELVKELGLTKW